MISQGSYCQDIIKFKNGNNRKVFVLTTTETEITSRDFETKEIFTVSKDLVVSVEYQNGKSEPLGATMPQLIIYRKDALTYNGNDYTRPKTIKMILLKNPDVVVTDQFNAYRTKRTFSQAFTLLGSGSLGWNIGDAVSGGKLDGKLLGGSVGAFIIGLILDKASNRNLKSAVDAYNDNLVRNDITFKPIKHQDLNLQANIGFCFRF
jgi:hypothetical protein